MTKIYLVCGYKCNQMGQVINPRFYYVDRVFKNKKLAEKCANWLNETWRECIANPPEPNFNYYFYNVKIEIISKDNYKELPY